MADKNSGQQAQAGQDDQKPGYGEATMNRQHTPKGPQTKITKGTARGTRSGTGRSGTH